MLRLVVIAAVLAAATVFAEEEKGPVAMGNLQVVYNLTSAISTEKHEMSGNFLGNNGSLWCQALKNNKSYPIERVEFVRGKDRLNASRIDEIENKAYFDVPHNALKNAGKYRCEILTKEAQASGKENTHIFGNLFAYSRPYFHANGLQLPEAKEPFNVTSTSLTAVEGDTVNITCPKRGYPDPVVVWFKDGEEILSTARVTFHSSPYPHDPAILQLDKVEKGDEGVYRCVATNEFEPYSFSGRREIFTATLNQRLRISSHFGWIYPLLVIIVILILLFIIIYACKACGRYKYDNYNVAKREQRYGAPQAPSTTSSGGGRKLLRPHDVQRGGTPTKAAKYEPVDV